MTIETSLSPSQKNRSALYTALGLLLLAPAALCCVVGLVVPTIRTISMSFQKVDLLSRAEAVGMANYAQLFNDRRFAEALGFTLSIAVVRLLFVAIVPLLLALAVSQFGRWVRIPVRLLFTIPLALFAPVASAVAWLLALHPQIGLLRGQDGGPPLLADPARAGSTLLFIDGITSFGLACGLGLIFYLAALRRPDAPAPAGGGVARPLIVTWVVGLLATAALALQSFTLSYGMTGGGPANRTATLALYQYMQGFVQFRFGPASALATLLLLSVGVLGLATGLLVVFSRLRLEHMPAGLAGETTSADSKVGFALLLGLLLIGSATVAALSIWPLPWAALNSLKSASALLGASAPPASTGSLDAYDQLAEQLPLGRIQLNTLLSPLLAVFLIQMPLAYAGALGIGALRPLGRRSEWLLLPFSPWLFMTIGPLSMVAFMNMRSLGLLNTQLGLVPPILVSVPALFILTLFFKGQEPGWRAAQAEGRSGAFFRTVVLPSLPLAALLALALLLVEMRSLMWPLLVTTDRGLFTGSVALLAMARTFASDWPTVMAAIVSLGLPFCLLFLLAFSVFQIFYLDRLAIRAGGE